MIDTLQRQFNEQMDAVMEEYSDEGHDEYTFVTLLTSWLNINGYDLVIKE